MHMFFSKSAEGVKVLEAACNAAGVKARLSRDSDRKHKLPLAHRQPRDRLPRAQQLDRGRMVGSPERLNLFTVEGDMLRLDLDLEAHLGSTLRQHSWIILEKGNRVPAERLSAIQEFRQQAGEQGGGGCAVM